MHWAAQPWTPMFYNITQANKSLPNRANPCTYWYWFWYIGQLASRLSVLQLCTSLQNFALAWKCLQILTQTCKTLQKHCKTLHSLARIDAGVDILGGSPAIHRIDCAASGSLRLPLHFLLITILFGFFIFKNSTYSLQFFARSQLLASTLLLKNIVCFFSSYSSFLYTSMNPL